MSIRTECKQYACVATLHVLWDELLIFFIFSFAVQIFTISEFNEDYGSCTIPLITYTLQEVGF